MSNMKEKKKEMFLAKGFEIPRIGSNYICIRFVEGDSETICTSTILDVMHMGGNTYKVETENSFYFINVLNI